MYWNSESMYSSDASLCWIVTLDVLKLNSKLGIVASVAVE